MLTLLSEKDEKILEEKLNKLGPSVQIVSIYAVNARHFAWVRIGPAERPKKKGKENEN